MISHQEIWKYIALLRENACMVDQCTEQMRAYETTLKNRISELLKWLKNLTGPSSIHNVVRPSDDDIASASTVLRKIREALGYERRTKLLKIDVRTTKSTLENAIVYFKELTNLQKDNVLKCTENSQSSSLSSESVSGSGEMNTTSRKKKSKKKSRKAGKNGKIKPRKVMLSKEALRALADKVEEHEQEHPKKVVFEPQSILKKPDPNQEVEELPEQHDIKVSNKNPKTKLYTSYVTTTDANGKKQTRFLANKPTPEQAYDAARLVLANKS